MSKDKKKENLQEQLTELDNQLKRAVADYHNLEKRIQEGRSELSKWATKDLIERLLPVLDNLETALQGAEPDSPWYKGVEMAAKQFKEVLKSEGVDEIEADGEFDPTLHEAVDTRDGESNMILEVAKKGYTLNGAVLRPAQVVVGRKSEDQERSTN